MKENRRKRIAIAAVTILGLTAAVVLYATRVPWEYEAEHLILQGREPAGRFLHFRLTAPSAELVFRPQVTDVFRFFFENLNRDTVLVTGDLPWDGNGFGSTAAIVADLEKGETYRIGFEHPPKNDFQFVFLGDSRDGFDAFDSILKDILTLDPLPEFLVHGGDVIRDGTALEYDVVRRQLGWYPLPIYFVPGCHDRRGRGDVYFRRLFGPLTGYFDYGGLRFVWIDNTRTRMRGKNRKTLTAARSAQPVLPHLLFMHRPLEDPRPGQDHRMEDEKGIQEIRHYLTEGPTEYVFASHIHEYGEGHYGEVPWVYSGGGGANNQLPPHYLLVTCHDGSVIGVEKHELPMPVHTVATSSN